MTFIEYSNILCEKSLGKEVVEKIKQQNKRRKEDKKVKWVVNSLNVAKRAIQKLAKNRARTNFMSAWFVVVIREASDRFHQNFAMGLKEHPLLYKGVNLGISTT